jgi:hypothetical protein
MTKSRKIICESHAARMEEKRNVRRLLVGKPERKRRLYRLRLRWVEIANLREIEWSDIDWVDLAQDRDQRKALINTVTNLRIP